MTVLDAANALPVYLRGTFDFDRRVDVRYECDSRSTGPSVRAGVETVSVRILNLSAGGLASLSDRRLDRGAVLSVELPWKGEVASRRLILSVKRAESQPSGSWKIGCELAAKLTTLELIALLSTTNHAPPAAREMSAPGEISTGADDSR
jgi:hypothetical protein